MTIVISAVNLRKGGTLTILRECLEEMAQLARTEGWRVVALVHRKELAEYEGIEYIEVPWSVRSWVHRLWCEYVTMYGISRRIGDIDLWLSLHDTTPRVKARHQAVYCHNSYPFFHWRWRHVWQNYRIVCFALFTRWIYRINLHRNDFVIVQQDWFRKAFQNMFGLAPNKILVFPPRGGDEDVNPNDNDNEDGNGNENGNVKFLYPAYPDVHKNMECACEAARLLEQEVGHGHFEVLLTTEGCDRRYAQWLRRKWGHVSSIRFMPFMSKDELFRLYAQTDCLIFPSYVETWGLPISEFAAFGRPMLLADLPYAHETAAGSRRTAFFNPDKPEDLKILMQEVMEGNYQRFDTIPTHQPEAPIVNSWREVVTKISSL